MDEPAQKAPIASKAAKETAEKDDDVALVCGATEDGSSLGVLRKRGERVEAAIMKRAVEGQPIHGELVKLTPREEPRLFDVESLYTPPAAETSGPGRPAQVASDGYRKGWDRLFKRRKRLPSSN